jgi:hypothetical protein
MRAVFWFLVAVLMLAHTLSAWYVVWPMFSEYGYFWDWVQSMTVTAYALSFDSSEQPVYPMLARCVSLVVAAFSVVPVVALIREVSVCSSITADNVASYAKCITKELPPSIIAAARDRICLLQISIDAATLPSGTCPYLNNSYAAIYAFEFILLFTVIAVAIYLAHIAHHVWLFRNIRATHRK